MPKSHRPLLAAVLAFGLGGIAQPVFAVGAKCPTDSAVLDVEPQFTNNILRCIARAQAGSACPPTHPEKVQMPVQAGQPAVQNPPFGPNADFCRTNNLIITAPSQVAQILCPPGMQRIVRNGADLCRATATSQVPPVLIPN